MTRLRLALFSSVALLPALLAVACDDAAEDGSTTSSSATTGVSSSASTGVSTGAGAAPPTRAPGMTDSSILFPLPASESGLDGLLRPDSEGVFGQLLPDHFFGKLEQLSIFESNKAKAYESLRVVGARLDPCFPKLAPGEPCRAQVRLVFQPFTIEGGFASIDAAIHVFYELPDDELVTLLGATTSVQSASDAEGPLRVHPTMQKEGLDGPAALAIKTAILQRAGRARMSRMTSMQLGGQANVWIFNGFEIAGETVTPLRIAASNETEQMLGNNALPDPQDFHGDVFPIVGPDDLGALYESDTANTLTDAQIFPLYEAALRAQNPHLHTADTVACATCHAAHAAEKWVDRNTDVEAMPTTARFTSAQDLTVPSDLFETRTQTVRAFGYQDLTPAVSQRTIFETAVLVDHFAGVAD